MKTYRFLVVAAVITILCGCSVKAAFVEGHKPKAIIVIPAGTTPHAGPVESTDTDVELKGGPKSEIQIKQGLVNENQWYSATANSVAVAAMELQNYIEKATGAKLEIKAEDKLSPDDASLNKIFVGPCRDTIAFIEVSKIQPEGFVIRTKDGNLYIVGRDQTPEGLPSDGTLNGCYEFLQRYIGVRWLMPGELGEVVPKTDSLKLGEIDIKEEPLLWQRRIRDCHAHLEYGRVADALKNWGFQMSEWEKFFDTDITNAWFRHHRLGARVKLKYMHSNMGYWDKYHKEYPDIFAMQPNGSRVNTNVREQLCVSNPKVWELVAEEKIKELKENPQLTAASITPNDGGENKFCCCEKCAALDPPGSPKIYGDDGNLRSPQISLTDRYFRYYNEVAKQVAKELPGRFLGVYAYSVYKLPPVTLDRLEKNLIVGYVGFNSYLDDKKRQEDRVLWLNWGKLAKQLFIRPNLFWYNMGLPTNYARKVAADIRFMADNGMRASDFDGLIGNWGSEGLNYYVVAQTLWNPYADVNEIINDYCQAAYGKGAPAMKEYYSWLEELTGRIAREGEYVRRADAEKLFGYYTDEVLKQLQSHLDNAVDAIGGSDPAAVERVKLVADCLDYAQKVRQLVLAAYNVRTGQSTKEEFDRIKTETDKYFASHIKQWSVATAHNYTYILQTLSLSREKSKGQFRD
jgi:hypothetical protein